MRVTQLQLQRFKGFANYTLHLSDDVTLLIGDNGVGKSSILQAIAATLGTATRQIYRANDLNWPGFVVDELASNYRGFADVTLSVQFSADERAATRDFYQWSDYATLSNATEPADYSSVQLHWSNNPQREHEVTTDPAGASVYYQFHGRRYAYNLLHNRNAQPDMFTKIGGVFWYTEQRTAYSLSPFVTEGDTPKNGKQPVQQVSDEDSMRRLFIKWFASAPHKKDQFNTYYSRLFPNRSLKRIADAYGAAVSPVYFADGNGNEYDVSELSAGERALMPLLLDFVEWGIHNSVILIDELELHLHPPLQQALLMLLPTLGKNNQFIITTHSDAVAELVPQSALRFIDHETVSRS